jgi:hypothetical protein
MSSSSEGDSKGDTTDSKEAEHRSNSVKQQGISNLDSSPPPQSVILPGYYPAQFSRQQAGFTSPEISYYYQQQQSYRASVPSSTTSSAVESTQRRESPVYFGRGYHPQQQAYGGAPGRIYEASGSDSGGTHPRGVASEVELGVGVVAGAAAAAASMLYQTSYPGAKVNYSPSYPTVGGSSSQTGYPEGLSRRQVSLNIPFRSNFIVNRPHSFSSFPSPLSYQANSSSTNFVPTSSLFATRTWCAKCLYSIRSSSGIRRIHKWSREASRAYTFR